MNDAYNEIAKQYCINKSVIAYRNIFDGKSNIHFAKEVIDFISKQKKAFVYVSDFSKFFDRLNHKYLKEKLCEVLKVDTGNLVGFEDSVRYEVESVKGLGNILFGGEGLFLTKLTGPGKVILQTMNMNEFALRVGSYIPTSTT